MGAASAQPGIFVLLRSCSALWFFMIPQKLLFRA